MSTRFRIISAAAVLFAAAAAGAGARAEYPDFPAIRERASKFWTDENTAQGATVVLLPPGSPLEPAAKSLAAYRKAEILPYDPAKPEELLETLIRKKARYAAIFAEPKDMDANLVRRFLVLSTLLDDDPFCDLAFGFVTGSTPKKAEAFVAAMIRADRAGVKPYAIQLCMSNVSQKYEGSTFLPGVPGEAWYVNQGDLEFARKALAELPRAGFVHLGGCADPEGIWMFDDDRNRHPELHWPYDPKRVGEDPKGEMTRMKAGEFRTLRLDGAVVWTHCCHLGSVDRVFVEGDIVSTFGSSEKLEEYRIPPGRSVALAILDAGPSAYLAPLGPNFGAQSDIEQAIAGELGLPLGDVMRRAYHDVVMDTAGRPEQVGIYIPGKPAHWQPDDFVNNDSPHNRCLYGDPLFAPLKGKPSPPTVEIGAEEKADGIALTFRVKASGYLGRTWYGNRGRENPGRGRIYEAIPLKRNVRFVSFGEIRTRDAGGKPFPVCSKAALIERIDGKTFLHVQLVTDAPEALGKAGASVEAFVKWEAVPTREAPGEKPADKKPAEEGAAPPGEPGSPVDTALAAAWGIGKREWQVEEFCRYVEGFLRDFGEKSGAGRLTFAFDDDARDALQAKAVIDLDGKPLMNAVEGICRQLGLKYSVDRKANEVRFSRSKGIEPGKAEGEGGKPGGEGGNPPAPPAGEEAKPAAQGAPAGAAIPAGQHEEAYVILTDIPEKAPYFRAVAKLREVHPEAKVLVFPKGDPEAASAALRALRPRNVVVVLEPGTLDMNFQGRFLLLCARMDDDPFPDFSYGYLTGATAEEAVRFAENIGKAWKTERPRKLLEAPTIGQGASRRTESPSSPEYGVDWPQTTLMFGEVEGKPMTEEQAGSFLKERLGDWKGNGAVMMGGHGSPTGIHGNVTGAALRAARTDLFPAFVYNYACLTGCVSRAFEWIEKPEEFGTVRGKAVDPSKSMALAVIACGATGYVASLEPRPSGPGMSGELLWALTSGETTGETRRREYAMLVLGFLDWGEKGLVVPSYRDGEPRKPTRDAVRDIMMMNASGAVLFGDPAMRLAPKSRDAVRTRWTPEGGAFLLEAVVETDTYGFTFDPYRTWGADRQMASKVYAAADLPAGVSSVERVEAVEVQSGGQAVSFDRLAWAVERIGDARKLHVKVNVPPGAVARAGSRAVFRVYPAGTGASGGAKKAPSSPPAGEGPPPGEGDAPVDKALAAPWFLQRREWTLKDILRFVEDYLRDFGEKGGVGRLTFAFDDDALDAPAKTVTIELESKPLKDAVEDVCRQLGLKYSVDRKANAVRFSRSKGSEPGKTKPEGEGKGPSEPGSGPAEEKGGAAGGAGGEGETGEPRWRPGPQPDTEESAKKLREILRLMKGESGVSTNEVRWKAVQDIGALRTPEARRALEEIFAQEKDLLTRFYAVLGIAGVDGREAALFLLEGLSAEKEAYVLGGFRDALRKLGTKEAAEALAGTGLRHRDPAVRAEAAVALGGLQWKGALAPLVQALRDSQAGPRVAAIEALGRLGFPEAVDALLKEASGGEAETVLAALGALGDSPSKDPRIVALAVSHLEKGRMLPLKIQAAMVLGRRKDPAGLKPLIACLDHADWRLRSAAIGALGRIRHRDAVEPLVGRLGKEQGRLAYEVAQALYRITGLDYGADAPLWRAWWGKNKETFSPPPVLQEEKTRGKELTEASYHGIPVVSKRIVFILDVSSSMSAKISLKSIPAGGQGGPKGDTRLDYCKWELCATIRKLAKDVRFNLVTFGDVVRIWQKGIVPAVQPYKGESLKFVEDAKTEGGTDLYDALKAAFEDPEADTFYLLSDGDPTAGPVTDQEEILRWIRRTNVSRMVAIHTIGAGELVSADFLKKMAEQNGGKSVVIK